MTYKNFRMMKEEDISNWVLKNIMLFFFLQEFDYYRQSGDPNSQNAVRRFAEENLENSNSLHNFQLVQLDTALGILLPVFAYSARVEPDVWEKVGFSIAPHYKCVTYNKDGQGCPLDTDHFLRIVRNALAHYADFLSGGDDPTVFFEPKVIRFKAKAGEIHFPEEGGYIHFISDFLRATKAVIRISLSSSPTTY